MALSDFNLLLNNDFTYTLRQVVAPSPLPPAPGTQAPVTVINGAGGPNVNFSGGSTGMTFTGTGNTVTMAGILVIANGGTGSSTAAGARTNLGAAASGANADINTFSALTGSTGWTAWTGGSDKTSHATYPTTTANVTYLASDTQGLMDKMKQQTEAHKALVDTLLASGVLKP